MVLLSLFQNSDLNSFVIISKFWTLFFILFFYFNNEILIVYLTKSLYCNYIFAFPLVRDGFAKGYLKIKKKKRGPSN